MVAVAGLYSQCSSDNLTNKSPVPHATPPAEVPELTSIEIELNQLARQLSARLPMMLDQATRLDSVIVAPGPRLIFANTIVTSAARMVDQAAARQHLQTLKKATICTDPELRPLLSNGVTLTYSYRGADGAHLATADFAAKDCP